MRVHVKLGLEDSRGGLATRDDFFNLEFCVRFSDIRSWGNDPTRDE